MTGVVKGRVTSSQEAPASQEAEAQREPFVPIDIAGMVQCRATSSGTRCAGRRSPATLLDFPPGTFFERSWTWWRTGLLRL